MASEASGTTSKPRENPKKVIITIDGPAASGKSSVSREIARRFGWNWVSTGIFYRGIAWASAAIGLKVDDVSGILSLIKSDRWEVELTGEQTRFLFDEVDCSGEVSRENVGTWASKISSHPEVRTALLEAQRSCVKRGKGLVAEGRDCGSVVFPNADLKIFLTASAEDRAARRAKDEGRDVQSLIDQQKDRDQQDSTRKAAPMVAPEGAQLLDTTGMTLVQVVDKIDGLIRAKLFAK